jgi:hypothetical protein
MCSSGLSLVLKLFVKWTWLLSHSTSFSMVQQIKNNKRLGGPFSSLHYIQATAHSDGIPPELGFKVHGVNSLYVIPQLAIALHLAPG